MSTKSQNFYAVVKSRIQKLNSAKEATAYGKKLCENINANYFELGGVLDRVCSESWFAGYEGYENFEHYVYGEYGFQGRKARYLIEIYRYLTEKNISWDRVKGVGWTKVKDIVKALRDGFTKHSFDDLIEKALVLNVLELQAYMADSLPPAKEAAPRKIKVVVSDLVEQRWEQALEVSAAKIGSRDPAVLIGVMCDLFFAEYGYPVKKKGKKSTAKKSTPSITEDMETLTFTH